jgi:hypothetical protein
VQKNFRPGWIVRALGLPLYVLAIHGSGCRSVPQPSGAQPEASQRNQTAAVDVAERDDLERDEERGGHTLRRHVARSMY